ncbi:hypothetical protein BOTCAL_0702g00030 [Botryotinia calthae]|uniref:Uncharacterized protein n=1 Tax=Botryotinia calthae TaxID=38488 RepID=A0A4Y8CJL0_9HELO|nr:hypothetical protein BOTCAL_0702g00030 [Botryotinia calthae]
MRAELALDEPLDTILDHLLSNSSKHLSKSEQEGSTTPRRLKQEHRFASPTLFSDLLEQKQNGQFGDDDDTIVYDATTTHQPKKYIADQVIYTPGLINSYYSSSLDGHEEFSALSDVRFWNAFKSDLRLAKEGYLGERFLLEERMDLNSWVEYMNVEQ